MASSTVMRCLRAPDGALHVRARDLGLQGHHRLEGTGRVVRGLGGADARVEEAAQGEHAVEALGAVLAHLLAVVVDVGREGRGDGAQGLDAGHEGVVDHRAVLEAEAGVAPRALALQPLVDAQHDVDGLVAVRVDADLPVGLVDRAQPLVELRLRSDQDAPVVRAGPRRGRAGARCARRWTRRTRPS